MSFPPATTTARLAIAPLRRLFLKNPASPRQAPTLLCRRGISAWVATRQGDLPAVKRQQPIRVNSSSLSSPPRRWKSAEPLNFDDHHQDTTLPSEEQLRFDLAVAHRLTARYNMDMLTWNHISHRMGNDQCLITPGDKLFDQVRPEDLVVSSTNVTADIIHAAIYAARPDVNAIIHVHTPAATAVSCLEQGFVPYTQDSAYFNGKVARYDWDGLSNKLEEGPLLQAAVTAIPDCNTLLMNHHGFACFGQSVKEAWVLAYYFERACDVQCRIMASGGTPLRPDPRVMAGAAESSYLPEFAPGAAEWDALAASVSFDD